MSRELIIRPEAEADIALAFGWYEARVSGLGSEFLLVLDAAFNSIVRNPNLYPRVHKRVRRALTRRFPFAIFFVAERRRIVVLSVFHVKRNPQAWKKGA
jgi:plasmid stabilization system protein ParE